jgi:hypothetical protein
MHVSLCHAVPMVCERAGCTRGALMHHYPSLAVV